MSGYVSPKRYDKNGKPTTSSIRDDIGKAMKEVSSKKKSGLSDVDKITGVATGGALGGFMKGYAAPGGNLTNGILSAVKNSTKAMNGELAKQKAGKKK